MKGNDFLDKMELVDPAFIEAADTDTVSRKHRTIRRSVIALAACLCLIAGAFSTFFPYRTKARVSYDVKDLPQTLPMTSDRIELLTEEELFSYENMYVFRGKVQNLTNLTIDFNGEKEVRCVATITIEKVYQGALSAGEQIKMLLPCPIGTNIWVEDTNIISQLQTGMEGIFMPWIYDNDENSYWEQNHATLMKYDLAPCGLADGMQWAFLSTKQGLIFDKRAYSGAENAVTLDDIEAYVIENLK